VHGDCDTIVLPRVHDGRHRSPVTGRSPAGHPHSSHSLPRAHGTNDGTTVTYSVPPQCEVDEHDKDASTTDAMTAQRRASASDVSSTPSPSSRHRPVLSLSLSCHRDAHALAHTPSSLPSTPPTTCAPCRPSPIIVSLAVSRTTATRSLTFPRPHGTDDPCHYDVTMTMMRRRAEHHLVSPSPCPHPCHHIHVPVSSLTLTRDDNDNRHDEAQQYASRFLTLPPRHALTIRRRHPLPTSLLCTPTLVCNAT